MIREALAGLALTGGGLLVSGCGVGGIALAAAGGGGGGGSQTPPPRPVVEAESPAAEPASNFVVLRYELRDARVRPDENGRLSGANDVRVVITPQFRAQGTDAGSTRGRGPLNRFWVPMTEADVAASDGVRQIPLGERTFVWNSTADLGGYVGAVEVRFLAEYELTTGLRRQFRVRPTEFNLDNGRAGTVLGGDVFSLGDRSALIRGFTVDGDALVIGASGVGMVERVGPDGVPERIVGFGAPGDPGEGSPPGVARLRDLLGIELGPTGHVLSLEDERIRLTNDGTVPVGFAATQVPPNSVSTVVDAVPEALTLRMHPAGVLLVGTLSGTLVAVNAEPVGGANRMLAGVLLAPGEQAVVAGGGNGDPDGRPALDTALGPVRSLSFGPDGEVYFVDQSFRVLVWNPGSTPVSLATGDVAAGAIDRVVGSDLDTFSGDRGPISGAQLSGTNSVFVTADRRLFIQQADSVRLANLSSTDTTFAGVTIASGEIDTVAGTATFSTPSLGAQALDFDFQNPFLVALHGQTNLLVANAGAIYMVNGGSETVSAFGVSVAAGRVDRVYDIQGRGGVPLRRPRAARAVAGLVYFADLSTVRAYSLLSQPIVLGSTRVDPGKTAVVAGGSLPGFGGDGGSVRGAAFSAPSGMAVVGTRSLYVADAGNDRVRFVNLADASPLLGNDAVDVLGRSIPAGGVDTVIGGGAGPLVDDGDGLAATDAVLSSPRDVAVGFVATPSAFRTAVFVADTGHHRVRVANPEATDLTLLGTVIAPGTIGTVLGDGAAGFTPDGPGPWAIDTPTALEIDGSGILYFAESGNARIRVLNLSRTTHSRAGIDVPPGEIRTIAGTGSRGRSGDGALAIDAEIDEPASLSLVTTNGEPFVLYFSDARQHVVRMINLTDEDIPIDADDDGALVRQLVSGGIATVAGGPNQPLVANVPGFSGDGEIPGTIRFAAPWGVAALSENDLLSGLFVADRDNDRLRRIGSPPFGIEIPVGLAIPDPEPGDL